MVRTRLRGQSVVEFGIIAILFTLIMFAIADFGLLLNDWLTISSDARLLARDAAVGMNQGFLWNEATAQAKAIPGVSADPIFTSICCDVGTPGAAVQVNTVYWIQCTPGAILCLPVDPTMLDDRYMSRGVQGSCHTWAPPTNIP